MWNCENCGCQNIAGDRNMCPMCGKERQMPKVTTDGGSSNAGDPVPEPTEVASDTDEAVSGTPADPSAALPAAEPDVLGPTDADMEQVTTPASAEEEIVDEQHELADEEEELEARLQQLRDAQNKK